jgi:hypothetical protein
MTFLKMRASFWKGWSWTTGRGASVFRLVVQYVAFVLDTSWNKVNFKSNSHIVEFGILTSCYISPKFNGRLVRKRNGQSFLGLGIQHVVKHSTVISCIRNLHRAAMLVSDIFVIFSCNVQLQLNST